MVIGDELSYSDLYTAAQHAEGKLRRKVNPLFLSLKDWRRKASDKGSVVGKIRRSPKISIIGSEKDLPLMGKQELDNLVQIGKLKAEAASRQELDGMPASARRGLVDVQNESIETDSRINRSRPEERALARVSKDGHKRDRASSHPSRRRFAPPQE